MWVQMKNNTFIFTGLKASMAHWLSPGNTGPTVEFPAGGGRGGSLSSDLTVTSGFSHPLP